MGKPQCHACIERIREIRPDCPAVRMHDNWKNLCGFPEWIMVSEEDCAACKDPAGELQECYCEVMKKQTGGESGDR